MKQCISTSGKRTITIMSAALALSSSSLASHSSYRSLSEEDQRRVRDKKKEREARSLALEKAYVHDVYEQISGE